MSHAFLRAARYARCDLSLYLVADRASATCLPDFFSRIDACVRGGFTCVQLRDTSTQDPKLKLDTAVRLQSLLKKAGVTLMINNDIALAQAASADGIYLEDPSISPEATRKILGSKALIGVPARTLEEVKAWEGRDVDYLSVKVFPSKRTHPVADPHVWGLEGLKRIRALSLHRLVAIGGIDLACFPQILRILNMYHRGEDGVAMVGDLWRGPDPELIARQMAHKLMTFRSTGVLA